MPKRKTPKKSTWTWKHRWTAFVTLALLFLWMKAGIDWVGIHHGTRWWGKTTRGMVGHEYHFWGNSGVIGKKSLYFHFRYEDTFYRGECWDPDARPGDSVVVVFVPFWPAWNKVRDE